jgi:hypothetical protein
MVRAKYKFCVHIKALTKQTSIRPPESFHSVSSKRSTCELGQRFSHVIVAQWRDFEEGHTVSVSVSFSLGYAYSPFKFQVKSIAYEYFRYSRSMLETKVR